MPHPMRLVLVHGINQQGKDPQHLKHAWIQDLESGLGRPGAFDAVDIELPFYGDALQAAAADIKPADIVEEQQRQAAGAAGAVAVEQGFPMSRRINAIVSLLEKISPWRGDLAVRLLSQAYQYLRKPHVASAVDAKVRPALARGPAVVVAHSLGTVVSFKLMRELAGAGAAPDVPLYVTCGSPLTLSTVQRAVQPPFATPQRVARWLNVRDPDDFISLDRSLVPPLYPGPIENRSDFENPGEDAHAIPGYLSYAPLARAVAVRCTRARLLSSLPVDPTRSQSARGVAATVRRGACMPCDARVPVGRKCATPPVAPRRERPRAVGGSVQPVVPRGTVP